MIFGNVNLQAKPFRTNAEEHYLDKRKVSGSGDNFFNSVESGVAQIVRQDKLQEEYQKVNILYNIYFKTNEWLSIVHVGLRRSII